MRLELQTSGEPRRFRACGTFIPVLIYRSHFAAIHQKSTQALEFITMESIALLALITDLRRRNISDILKSKYRNSDL